METQCGVPFASEHSTPVDTSADIAAIANRLIAECVFRFEPGREAPECKDIFMDGQAALARMKPLVKYIRNIKRRLGQTDSMAEGEEAIGLAEEDEAAEDEHNPAENSGSDDDPEVDDVISDEGDDWLNDADRDI